MYCDINNIEKRFVVESTSDEKYTLSVVKDFNVVIVDEVHTINEKKNKISKIIV
jgi:replicative superfamily II helicase